MGYCLALLAPTALRSEMTASAEIKMFFCQDIFRGCGHICSGESDTDMLIQIARHLRAEHGLREISPELLNKIRAALHSRSMAAS